MTQESGARRSKLNQFDSVVAAAENEANFARFRDGDKVCNVVAGVVCLAQRVGPSSSSSASGVKSQTITGEEEMLPLATQ